MKNFSLKDESGKIYYGWWIVLAAAIICGLVYSGIVSVTGVFLLPVTTALELPIGGYSFYLTIMSLTQIVTLLVISKFLTAKKHKEDYDNRRNPGNYFIYRFRHGKITDLVLHIRCSAGILLRSLHHDAMPDSRFQLVRRKIKRKGHESVSSRHVTYNRCSYEYAELHRSQCKLAGRIFHSGSMRAGVPAYRTQGRSVESRRKKYETYG